MMGRQLKMIPAFRTPGTCQTRFLSGCNRIFDNDRWDNGAVEGPKIESQMERPAES